MENQQLDLFGFEDLHPQKNEHKEIKPFFLVTVGYCYDRLKYGVTEVNQMLTTKFEDAEDVKAILSRLIGLEKAEYYIQKAMENQDEWQQYNDTSMYYF